MLIDLILNIKQKVVLEHETKSIVGKEVRAINYQSFLWRSR
jgi:hypothetical protein